MASPWLKRAIIARLEVLDTKLYNGFSPNGARVAAFLAEKDVTIPTVDVSVLKGETRTPEFRKINSLGQIPVLELNDGTILTESVAICRYLESLYPKPFLFGEDALAQLGLRCGTGSD